MTRLVAIALVGEKVATMVENLEDVEIEALLHPLYNFHVFAWAVSQNCCPNKWMKLTDPLEDAEVQGRIGALLEREKCRA
mmetsp:Transcript_17988/g.27247  ORF Transcript_17988/g.27247 Transcript_17988/m.27247 type:complete len:80 (-) Transcript_17988:6129-6368(-)